MKREDLVDYLDQRLAIDAARDSSNNGLQVQGAKEVQRIALAVDAALATYRKAAEQGCEMLIVHHGLIWGGLAAITGRVHEHVAYLLEQGINLYAAHLPLDMHQEIGNAAVLARLLGLEERASFGQYHGVCLGVVGKLAAPLSAEALADKCRAAVGAEPIVAPFGKKSISTVAAVSGSGSFALQQAIDQGIDCFVTGDGKHQDYHLALEAGINVIYLGHYHSETTGVRALGQELAERFGLSTCFVDEPTVFG